MCLTERQREGRKGGNKVLPRKRLDSAELSASLAVAVGAVFCSGIGVVEVDLPSLRDGLFKFHNSINSAKCLHLSEQDPVSISRANLASDSRISLHCHQKSCLMKSEHSNAHDAVLIAAPATFAQR